jgi:hypothetical protein
VTGESIDMYYGLSPEERLPPLPTTEVAPVMHINQHEQHEQHFLPLTEEKQTTRTDHPPTYHTQPQHETFQTQEMIAQPITSKLPAFETFKQTTENISRDPPKEIQREPRKTQVKSLQDFTAPTMEWDATL